MDGSKAETPDTLGHPPPSANIVSTRDMSWIISPHLPAVNPLRHGSARLGIKSQSGPTCLRGKYMEHGIRIITSLVSVNELLTSEIHFSSSVSLVASS